MLNLKSRYLNYCMSRGWKPRKYIVELLEALEDSQDSLEPYLIILDLPTGYGKTSISEILLGSLVEGGSRDHSRVIHILPYRAIIRQLERTLKQTYRDDVGSVYMGVKDTPFLARKYVITTFDSFLYSFMKIPPIELAKALRYGVTHHELVRSLIYSSMVIFDESHLFISKSKYGYIVLERIVKSLSRVGVPVILSSASLPKRFINKIRDELESGIGIKVSLIRYIKDPAFEKIHNVGIRVWRYDGGVLDLLNNYVDDFHGKRILIIFNRIIDAYKVLKEYLNDNKLIRFYGYPLFIHGKIPINLKDRLIDRLVGNGWRIAITTHSIEAGVDISADILITVPTHPDSMIQRIGRVKRWATDLWGPGEVILLHNLDEYGVKPFDEEVAMDTFNKLMVYEDKVMPKSRLVEALLGEMEFGDIDDMGWGDTIEGLVYAADGLITMTPNEILGLIRRMESEIGKEGILFSDYVKLYPIEMVDGEYRVRDSGLGFITYNLEHPRYDSELKGMIRSYRLGIKNGKPVTMNDEQVRRIIGKWRDLQYILYEEGLDGLGIPLEYIFDKYIPEEYLMVIRNENEC